MVKSNLILLILCLFARTVFYLIYTQVAISVVYISHTLNTFTIIAHEANNWPFSMLEQFL